MTPQHKIKHAIINLANSWDGRAPLPENVTAEDIDRIYDELDENYGLQDARNEIRSTGIETGLPCEWSRHYESEAVAAQMPDGSWVGWTHWHGGGKHGGPDAIDWISDAYDVNCVEKTKLVVVHEFSKPEPCTT